MSTKHSSDEENNALAPKNSQDATNAETPTEITLERTAGPALRFCGYPIKMVVGDRSGTKNNARAHILTLYGVVSLGLEQSPNYGGGYVVGIEYRSSFHEDTNKSDLILAATVEDVWRGLAGYDASRDVTVREGSISKERLSHIHHAVSKRFRDAANRILSALPELSDRLVDLSWKCDECGQSVDTRNGFVEWRMREGQSRGDCLRLVHGPDSSGGDQITSCTYDEGEDDVVSAGDHVVEFLGHDGLMRLLGLITDGMCEQGEVVEMIKRLHIPRYEQARLYFDAAKQDGRDRDLNMPYGSYSQAMLTDIITHYGPKPAEPISLAMHQKKGEK